MQSKLSLYVYPVVAVLALAAAFSARAEIDSPPMEGTPSDSRPAVPVFSSTTRAAVRAELASARAAGTLDSYGEGADPRHYAASLRTRSEVRAEAIAARRSGYIAGMYGEDSGAFYLAHTARPPGSGHILAAR